MKHLLILLLCFAGWTAKGQSNPSQTFTIPKDTWLKGDRIVQGDTSTWTISSLTYKPVVAKITGTLVALQLSPIVPIDSNYTDVEIFKMLLPRMTKGDFDNMQNRFIFNPSSGMRIVEIRFIIHGRTTDYTFEEFKKYLWP